MGSTNNRGTRMTVKILRGDNRNTLKTLEDNDGKKVRFILVENFNANGNDCKKVRFNEPLKLSSNDQGTDVSLDICKINNNYEISSINLSK